MSAVLTVLDVRVSDIRSLLSRFGIKLDVVADGEAIPSSYWGDPEAGMRGNTLYARVDTPLHSVLHEASHMIVMPSERRTALDRDAGGDDEEECAVCYLQILLADELPGFGRERCCDDMDAWGYSFREGSVRDWLAGDAEDAKRWLRVRKLVADWSGNGGLNASPRLRPMVFVVSPCCE